ncbi:hypothetical protein [Thioalkalivibrio sp. ARh3]|uniref:hypothetical protein n=1 Tax=Thioalkalivibrio sp. ARh3 TaxID=1158148 RepID=UPI0003622466|nr:hypothetical protein [Thioalkalivibrio sp. ARh3]
MDVLTFIAEFIKAIAWPLAFVFAVYLLKAPLTSLIPLMQRVKFKDLEVSFGQEVAALKEEAEESLGPAHAPLKVSPKVVKLAEVSPRAAVLEAWLDVEFTALEAAERRGVELEARQKSSPMAVIGALYRAGLVDDGTQNMFRNLFALRSHAIHDYDHGDLNAEGAVNYADMCARLVERLSKV